MTHFFATMIRESYDIRATKPEVWYDPKTKTGKLSSYLLDPGNIFNDRYVNVHTGNFLFLHQFSHFRLSKYITMLAYNTTNYEEIALKRFEENIGVLNFYFDTPIITQIQLELRQVNE